jgi:HEAT repeat protein
MNYSWENLQELDYENEQDRKILFDLTKDKTPLNRGEALAWLSNWRDEDVWQRLVEALDDPDELVKVDAIEGLAHHGRGNDFEKISPFLSSTSYLVAEAAEFAVGEIGNPLAIPLLRQILSNLRGTERVIILGSLYKLGEKVRLEEIIEQLGDTEEFVRNRAFNVLSSIIDEKNAHDILPVISKAIEFETIEQRKAEIKEKFQKLSSRFKA